MKLPENMPEALEIAGSDIRNLQNVKNYSKD